MKKELIEPIYNDLWARMSAIHPVVMSISIDDRETNPLSHEQITHLTAINDDLRNLKDIFTKTQAEGIADLWNRVTVYLSEYADRYPHHFPEDHPVRTRPRITTLLDSPFISVRIIDMNHSRGFPGFLEGLFNLTKKKSGDKKKEEEEVNGKMNTDQPNIPAEEQQ